MEWFDPAKKLPEDGQECIIMGHAQDGLLTQAVFGPIAWSKKNECWLDLFRDSEAGTLVKVDQVGCWTAWDAIKPPDGLPTPWPEPQPGEETAAAEADGTQ